MDQVDALLKGDRLALARILSQIENNAPESHRLLDILFRHAGKAHIIGVTGPAGSGKSTLVNRLALAYRRPQDGTSPKKVGILAIDPTSPFTGGAVLGDRVRMRDLSGDDGVFIRSMATRGTLGGLALTTGEMATALDAAGFDVIFVETVGVGQSEMEIARLAHTILLVENPGMGDDIQAIKAGILEIGSIIAINKADRPGVETTERVLRNMLEMNSAGYGDDADFHHGFKTDTAPALAESDAAAWQIPLIRTVATTGEGIPQVIEALHGHLQYLKTSGRWQVTQKDRLRRDLDNLIREVLFQTWLGRMSPEEYDRALDRLFTRTVSPFRLAEELIVTDYANKTQVNHLK
ncbi:MAG: methylmalonyl Co-A mutase-associated GTPase MeaB [Leptolinea sp.]|jgi:LAO/AO transport system kinase|nr:methylmalonyl Co-A mutase-associated GTPase MeaB [Leptolinea sp.]